MRTKKSLIAIAAMALSLMGFASSAMAATDGFVRETDGTNSLIPANRELHFIGWAKFDSGLGNVECHVTSILKTTGSTGTTGHVANFSVPDLSKCTLTGVFAGCTVSSVTSTTPWHVTATPTDFDITPIAPATKFIVHNHFVGGCLASGQDVNLTFSEVTIKPVKTGNTTITGGASPGKMGTTAANGDSIAGIEISGTGTADGAISAAVTATGELELTSPDRCTWKLVTS